MSLLDRVSSRDGQGSADNEATENKAEQLALDSSSRLAHYPKMGNSSHTLLSVFEPLSNSKPGPDEGPA